MGLVGAGGVLGAAAREAIEQAWPTAHHGLPAATLTINLVGALLLGLLLDLLSRLGRDEGARRRARLVVGTGFMGAFTTYSTFAIETDLLVKRSHPATAILYAALTVVGGLLAAALGIWLGTGLHAWTGRALPIDPDDGRDDP